MLNLAGPSLYSSKLGRGGRQCIVHCYPTSRSNSPTYQSPGGSTMLTLTGQRGSNLISETWPCDAEDVGVPEPVFFPEDEGQSSAQYSISASKIISFHSQPSVPKSLDNRVTTNSSASTSSPLHEGLGQYKEGRRYRGVSYKASAKKWVASIKVRLWANERSYKHGHHLSPRLIAPQCLRQVSNCISNWTWAGWKGSEAPRNLCFPGGSSQGVWQSSSGCERKVRGDMYGRSEDTSDWKSLVCKVHFFHLCLSLSSYNWNKLHLALPLFAVRPDSTSHAHPQAHAMKSFLHGWEGPMGPPSLVADITA